MELLEFRFSHYLQNPHPPSLDLNPTRTQAAEGTRLPERADYSCAVPESGEFGPEQSVNHALQA